VIKVFSSYPYSVLVKIQLLVASKRTWHAAA
jgi:hypothetical protein